MKKLGRILRNPMNKGDIWLVELPLANGHEQMGTRPAIVLAKSLNMVITIPLTSNPISMHFPYTVKINPSQTNGLNAKSIALLFQIRAIDQKRLKHNLGELENKTISQVDAHLRKMLNL